jgi:hypothetical protein
MARVGYDLTDRYRRAAGYVDRIPRGEKPADLPVQAPNRYELAINLKTASPWPRSSGFPHRGGKSEVGFRDCQVSF